MLTHTCVRKADLSDPELAATLEQYRQRADDHPCIYVRSLSDEHGNLLTVDHAKKLLEYLVMYTAHLGGEDLSRDDLEFLYDVDAKHDQYWTERKTANGQRRLLMTTSGDHPKERISDARVKYLKHFCASFKAHIDAAEENGVLVLQLQYVGYARKAGEPKQHEAHGKSANWLAILVQSILSVLANKDGTFPEYSVYFARVAGWHVPTPAMRRRGSIVRNGHTA